MRPKECERGHCWHVVGRYKGKTHGPFVQASPDVGHNTEGYEENAFRCCQCGTFEGFRNQEKLSVAEIDFKKEYRHMKEESHA